MQDYEYLLSSLDKIKGIGNKTIQLFLRKKIKTIFDLLWHLPISKIETSKTTDIKDLQLGKTIIDKDDGKGVIEDVEINGEMKILKIKIPFIF